MTQPAEMTDARTDLAEMVAIAREIAQLMRCDGLSREQRARLAAQYEDALGEIDVMLGLWSIHAPLPASASSIER